VIILAFDTSTSACSAAVWRDGEVLARRFATMARGQSEALVPMVAEVMAEAGLGYGDLTVVGVTVGPGAFTGVRIGLATARAMGLAASLPVAGLLTTEAIAHNVPEAERKLRTVVVAVDAKRADVFVQPFDQTLSPLGEVRGLLPEEVSGLGLAAPLLVGDGAARVAPHLPEAAVSAAAGVPDAAVVAAVLAGKWARGEALPPEPVYLRPPDVTLPPGAPQCRA
jgi:tRNA threonylcarbamoyladenosine biosynthesis protein TsaB